MDLPSWLVEITTPAGAQQQLSCHMKLSCKLSCKLLQSGEAAAACCGSWADRVACQQLICSLLCPACMFHMCMSACLAGFAQSSLSVPAGQWKYGQDRLKLHWAEQAESQSLLQKLISSKLPGPPALAVAAASAQTTAAWDVLADLPVDPLTGKLPLLLSAEELDKQFWTGSKPGRAMLEQVSPAYADGRLRCKYCSVDSVMLADLQQVFCL
jgi:hypothetical protein